jgi:nucleoside-diphosphate-sugar epimerase
MNENDVLTTGATGFVGPNLTNALAEANYVINIDDKSLGRMIEPQRREHILEDASVHDTMADRSKLTTATGGNPKISREESIERVYAPYR